MAAAGAPLTASSAATVSAANRLLILNAPSVYNACRTELYVVVIMIGGPSCIAARVLPVRLEELLHPAVTLPERGFDLPERHRAIDPAAETGAELDAVGVVRAVRCRFEPVSVDEAPVRPGDHLVHELAVLLPPRNPRAVGN